MKAIIFDLDGTLVYDEHRPEETRAALIADLSSVGFDTSSMNPHQPVQSIMDQAYSQIGDTGVKVTMQELRERQSHVLDEFDMKAYSKSAIKPGAATVVAGLKASGFLLGLFTNSGAKVTRLAVEKYNLQSYFDAIVTRDDVEKMKPDGEGLRKMIQLLNVEAEEAVYVGDSWVDVVAAREGGVRIIGVEGGMSSRERLQEQKPDFIIPSLSELQSLLT